MIGLVGSVLGEVVEILFGSLALLLGSFLIKFFLFAEGCISVCCCVWASSALCCCRMGFVCREVAELSIS